MDPMKAGCWQTHHGHTCLHPRAWSHPAARARSIRHPVLVQNTKMGRSPISNDSYDGVDQPG